MGVFLAGETKKRPGVYHRRENAGDTTQIVAINGIGAGLIRANWGPLNQAVSFGPFTDVNEVYGNDHTENLITEMFRGGIIAGKFVRIGSGGTAPFVTLTDERGAEAVRINGMFVGDRDFTVSIRDSLMSGKRECIIYEGTTEFQKYEFDGGEQEAEALVSIINKTAKDFTAERISRELPPSEENPAVSLIPAGQQSDLLGKTPADFAERALTFRTVSGNRIVPSGKLKYVSGYTGFNESVPEEQHGYYLPFVVVPASGGANVRIQVGDKPEKSSPDDNTFIVLLGEDDVRGRLKQIRVKVDADVYTLDLSYLEFDCTVGRPMMEITQAPFAKGTNPTVTIADYNNGLSILESAAYNVLCVDTEEIAVQMLVAAFLDRTYEAGALPMACLAGQKELELSERMDHAAAFNNEKICFCLNSARDAFGVLYDGYRLAARIGGMIASVPSNQSLTHKVIPDFITLEERLTNSQIERALSKGCIVLTENSDGKVWIEQAINTLTAPKADMDEGWRKIRRVKTRFELVQGITNAVDRLIGQINNDTDGRAAIIATGQGIINRMVAEKKLLSGTKILEDESNPAHGDSAWFVLEVYDVDSIEKLYLTFRFRFDAN